MIPTLSDDLLSTAGSWALFWALGFSNKQDTDIKGGDVKQLLFHD